MQFFSDLSQLNKVPSVVTVGKFDGMHLGHKKLILQAAAEKTAGMRTVLFTFSTPPSAILADTPGKGVLISREERRALAEQYGIDVMVEYPFDEKTRRMSAEYFYDHILRDGLDARVIAAGPDCCFGYQRRGDLAFLKKREADGGIRVVPVAKEQYRGEDISSTRIRAELARGNMEDVNAMLGYEYGIRTHILHGRHLGHSLGFPTINQPLPPEKALPPFGVYAARVTVNGSVYTGVSNLGIKPTIEGNETVGLETHILGFHDDIYGEEADVRLLSFVRPERKFDSLPELSAQIGRDKQAVIERNLL